MQPRAIQGKIGLRMQGLRRVAMNSDIGYNLGIRHLMALF